MEFIWWGKMDMKYERWGNRIDRMEEENWEIREGMVEGWKILWAMFEGVFCVPVLYLRVVLGGASDQVTLFLFLMNFGCWMAAAYTITF
jgi:hypothetical protein